MNQEVAYDLALEANNGASLNRPRSGQADTRMRGPHAAGAASGGLEGGPKSAYVGGLAKAAVFGLRVGEAALRDAGGD